MESLKSSVTGVDAATPEVKLITEADEQKEKSKIKSGSNSNLSESSAGLSDEQLLQLGWLGEQYFYNALLANKDNILSLFGVETPGACAFTWYNDGYESDCNWKDKSVGKGCDILIQEGDRNIYIEVKTSKKKAPIFTMTSFEMQTMKQKGSDYFLVKIDNIDALIEGKAPKVRIYSSPYEHFFDPSKMYSAIFYNN